MLKGQYIRNKHTGAVHKVEIGECEEYSKISSVKIFSEDMSHSYWVNKIDYEFAFLELIDLVISVKK